MKWTINRSNASIPKGFLLSHWSHSIALGFGSGLSPVMPGTCGSLLGVVLAWGLSIVPFFEAFCILIVLSFLGVYVCGYASQSLGEHDHGAIVWDEIVGFAWLMLFLPWSWLLASGALILFRLYDIFKPWPILWFDRKIGGGFGIMLDDVLAASAAWGTICLLSQIFPEYAIS